MRVCDAVKEKRLITSGDKSLKMGSGSSRPGTGGAPPSYLTPQDNINPGEVAVCPILLLELPCLFVGFFTTSNVQLHTPSYERECALDAHP